MTTFTYSGVLVQKVCPVCGIDYAAPERFFDHREDKGGSWYCPNGHSLVFTETTSAKLEAERERRESWERVARSRLDLLHAEERSHAATKGQVTKARKKLARVTNGVCPCCNRSFANLARHMGTKHPEYKPASGVPMK